jgi:putative adhesin
MRKAILGLVVLAAAAIPAAPVFAAEEVFQQTYALRAGGSFELQNVNGPVLVSGWERAAVEVYAKKTTRGDPRELQRVRIEVTTRPDSVSVQTRYPEGDGVEVFVEYHVRVPYHVELRHVGTVNGRVSVSGVETAGELRAVNGDVEVLDSAGRLSVRTTNGNVRVELRELAPDNPISVETVNGSVVLALPPEAGAELDVRSLNGDFRSDLPVALPAQADSPGAREFRGRLGSGGSPIKIRTVNGGIRVVTTRPTV